MSSINNRSKRRRTKPIKPYNPSTCTMEERLLQQAIQNSKVENFRQDGYLNLPSGPVFFPTIEEFEGNPMDYIAKIRPIAEKYGICKIVPPEGWNPPFCIDMNSPKRFQTKDQELNRLQEGLAFGNGEEYTASEYVRYASKKAKEWKDKNYPEDPDNNNCNETSNSNSKEGTNSESVPKKEKRVLNPLNVEKDYWDIVSSHKEEMSVEYGNDVDTDDFGSGFPYSERGRSVNSKADPDKVNMPEPKFGTDDYYKETGWNLNNIPCVSDSILRHVRVGINGINVPWLYFGCLFSTFCWHNEDNYLYSINYHHKGSPKQWYGVPGTKKDADGLERVFRSYLSMKMRDVPDLLHHITTMFSPRLLQNGGVPVYKLIQYAGEFVVTFPRSFHSGFSFGPNVGEAVNFASHDWISHGADASERYRSFARPAVFSHDRLTFTMANHLKEQKTHATCKLLLDELERVVDEEMKLRNKLTDAGVRDVSDCITLPKNVLDQLDEESADYDDKRLCHACKHVCFFSAVACECSRSKVSCLRHSHYMCRCPTERKYLMVWCDEKEMYLTLRKVKSYCNELKKKEEDEEERSTTPATITVFVGEEAATVAVDGGGSISDGKSPTEREKPATLLLREVAPGALRDEEAHRGDPLISYSTDFSSGSRFVHERGHSNNSSDGSSANNNNNNNKRKHISKGYFGYLGDGKWQWQW